MSNILVLNRESETRMQVIRGEGVTLQGAVDMCQAAITLFLKELVSAQPTIEQQCAEMERDGEQSGTVASPAVG